MDEEKSNKGAAQSSRHKRETFTTHATRALTGALAALLLIYLIGRLVPPEGKHTWADIILAVVTGLYVLVTYFQWSALRESIRVADEALEHAKVTADKTHELDRKARRAWILPEPWLFPGKDPKWANRAPWIYNLSFINIGQLPAFDAKVTARILGEEEKGAPSVSVETATGRAYFVRDQSHQYVVTLQEGSIEPGLAVRVEIAYTDPIRSEGLTAFTMTYHPEIDYGTFLLNREDRIVI